MTDFKGSSILKDEQQKINAGGNESSGDFLKKVRDEGKRVNATAQQKENFQTFLSKMFFFIFSSNCKFLPDLIYNFKSRWISMTWEQQFPCDNFIHNLVLVLQLNGVEELRFGVFIIDLWV